jgi:quercetin dioxygenase-like cupin family protein
MVFPYLLIEKLAQQLESIPTDAIVSRTIYKDQRLKAILFGFAAGQELSEHTSTQTALIQIIEGTATVTVGGDRHELGRGAMLVMPPNCPHSIFAQTPLTMLLLMVDPN